MDSEKEETKRVKKIICGLVVLGSFGLLFGADNAFVGKWKMNMAKSSAMMFDNGKLVKRSEAKEVILVVAVEGETTTVQSHGTFGGQPFSSKFTVPTAGGPLNYTEGAPPAGITDALKTVDDRTDDFISTENGKGVLTTHVVVTANHKMMTIRQFGVDEKGVPFKTVDVYDRQ
jgi:hypothetical protein